MRHGLIAGSSVRAWTSPRRRTSLTRIAVFSVIPTRRVPASCSWQPAAADHQADGHTMRWPRFACAPARSRVAREAGIATALGLGISRASLHRWRVRYDAGGLEALLDRPRGPAPARLPAWVEQAVIVVRLLAYWNSKRLAAEFTRREIYPLDHHAVDGLLAELGTARPSVRREHGPSYERSRPNELWHIDIKGPFFLASRGNARTVVPVANPVARSRNSS
jgi:transposase